MHLWEPDIKWFEAIWKALVDLILQRCRFPLKMIFMVYNAQWGKNTVYADKHRENYDNFIACELELKQLKGALKKVIDKREQIKLHVWENSKKRSQNPV